MGMRRVAVVAYHSSPLTEPGAGDAGGMTIFVRNLASALTAHGIHTDVFTRATAGSRAVVQIAEGVRVVAIEAGPRRALQKDVLRRYIDDFAGGIRAFATGQRIVYDVIHSHYWQSGLAARVLAERWNIPWVHSHHTLGRVKNRWLPDGDAPEPQSRLRAEEDIIREADVLVASTDEEWEQLSCLYGANHDRLKTIRPGVDHGLFRLGDRASARRELGIGDELVMLYVGRIQPLKGLELAIRAAEQLVPSLDRDLLFLVVGGPSGPGGGSEITRLQQLAASLGVDCNVRFAGPQPHSRLPSYYRAADVVVVCSHSESFGLAALEAQACGVPVVGTAVGGLSHVVKDGVSGFLVDTRDASVFAARLKTLLSDEDLRRSFSAAAVNSSLAFSWKRTAESFADLYDCLVREELPEACTC